MKLHLHCGVAITVFSVLALAAVAKEESVTHVVKPGDTLSGIARQYYGNARLWDHIVKVNSLADPDRLREGQILLIPTGERPSAQPSVPAHTPSSSADDGIRPSEPPATAPTAKSVQPTNSPAAALDSETMRRLAAAAVVQHYTNLNLASYNPGYLVRLESPTPESGRRVVVSWLNRQAMAVEKGASPEQDRKQVQKIEVWMTEDGRILKITDRTVWLTRNSGRAAVP